MLFSKKKVRRIQNQLKDNELKLEFDKILKYAKRYQFQVAFSVLLIIVLAVTLYQEPFTKAAPETGYVEVTSDEDWNLGTLDDVTVSSDSIEISGDGGANWINEAGWNLRQKINFNNTSGSAHDNFPVIIHIDSSNTDFWAGADSRDEVRFGDSDGTVLDFHFEKYDHTGDDAIAWVEVPNLASGSDHIYVYYSNDGAANGEDESGTYDDDGYFKGVWHLDETSGTSYDSTSSNIDLTPRNSPTQDETGKINGGDGFIGDGDALHNQSSSIVFGNSITMEGWFNRSGAGTGSGRTLEFSPTGNADSHCLAVDDNGSLRAWVECNTGSRVGSADDPTVYGTGTWYYFAYTYDGSTGRLYIDGDETDNAGGSCSDLADAGDSIIGAISDQSGQYSLAQHEFDGYLDEHRVASTARSAEWIKVVYLSETDTLISSWGAEESALQSPGTYTSHNIDLQYIYKWGDFTDPDPDSTTAFTTNVTVPANTSAKFEIRHSANGSTGWSSWTTVDTYTSSGTKTKTRSEMVALVGDIYNRYVQTRITLTSSDGTSNPSVADFRYDYTKDVDDPTNPDTTLGYSENGGDSITTNTWYNHSAPYFTWSGAADSDSGMSGGYSGYWVCFGAADCEPTSGTFRSTATYTASSLTSGNTYYLRIKARDASGNVADSAYAAFIYKYDATNPTNPGVVAANPAGYTNTNNFDFLWAAGSDADSGISGYYYKTGAVGATDTFTSDTYVSGLEAYQDGVNFFYVKSLDTAGNTPSSYTQVNYYYSASAPSEPTNLAVDPISSTTNSFTFSWDEPDSYTNPISGYYYSINALPSASNTTWTTSTSVGPDAFATQQGTNIFYVVAKDEAGNILWTSYSSVEFEANTTAPGIPTGVIVTDTSNREQQKYSLTITWDEPSNTGSGIDHYIVERSDDYPACEDGVAFSERATTDSLGYLDSGLDNTKNYCYRIKAADNAGATSAASSIVSENPRGRYYEAPDLVGNPGATTRIQSAIIEWLTDRECSSFVEYGTTTSYGSEMGQDDFVSSHEVSLISLSPDTTYHFRVRFTDEDNNTGYSGDYTFTTADAPSAPTNLAVTPTSSTTNSFAFSWDPPSDDGVTVEGYFYSVNSLPTASNTSYTTSEYLEAGPYATQQGTNTFYIVAIDDDQNINYSNYASVEFEANTAAPAIPSGLIITDASNRETEDYSIALKWKKSTAASTDDEEEVVYLVYRSKDDGSFESIAELQTTGYLDVDLDNTVEYSYYIKAKDSAGATSAASSTVSEIPEGRYTTPPSITSGPTVTPDSFSASVVWETERDTTSFVQYGLTDELGEEQGESDLIEIHSVNIQGLLPKTNYYYRVKSVDIDGNINTSGTQTFTTLEAPLVSDVKISDIRLYDALITWTTNKETTTVLQYGTITSYSQSYSDTSSSLTTNHTVKLDRLSDDTTYHFKPTGVDSTGNPPESSDYTFTTLTFPRVSDISFQNKAEGQTEVTWTTNVPTTSEVEYGNEYLPTKTQGNTAQVTAHSILLFGLEDDTTYQVNISGYDQFGYRATSDQESFTTLKDTTPPIVSNVVSESNTVGSGDASKVQIIVSWQTNEPATSQVEYGQGLASDSYSEKTDENTELVNDHLMVVSNLDPARTYHFRVVSKDRARNEAKSDSYSVLTSRNRESFLQLVIGNLEDTFSWIGNLGDMFQ